MRLILILSCVLVTFNQTNGSSKEHNVHTTEDTKKGEDASASNSSYYSTREMRDMCLKEWAGRTQEVKEYFDQLPSEEFKENSETLKLMYYYEKKGMMNVDSKQIYNITPQEVRIPSGPEYTIEVNDSYVPKYRITPSEEIRMEKYGTFHSPSEDSSEESVEGSTLGSVTTEPPDSEGEKPGGKKKRKKWPPHMDPKGKVRRRKKKKTLKADVMKRKKMVEEEINKPERIYLKATKSREENKYSNSPNNYQLGVLGINKKTKKIEFEEAYRKNIEDVMNRKQMKHSNVNKINFLVNKQGRFKGRGGLTPNIKRQKHVSIFHSFMTSCKLKHKHKDHNHHHQNLSRSRQRSWSYNHHLQPFL